MLLGTLHERNHLRGLHRFRLCQWTGTLQCDQLGLQLERSADCNIEFVAPGELGISPRKSLAGSGIIRLVVNHASAILKKRAALVSDACSPFSPPSLVNQICTVIQFDRRCFLI